MVLAQLDLDIVHEIISATTSSTLHQRRGRSLYTAVNVVFGQSECAGA
jgi:hypothetical protein